jgi:hypothetical protein
MVPGTARLHDDRHESGGDARVELSLIFPGGDAVSRPPFADLIVSKHRQAPSIRRHRHPAQPQSTLDLGVENGLVDGPIGEPPGPWRRCVVLDPDAGKPAIRRRAVHRDASRDENGPERRERSRG